MTSNANANSVRCPSEGNAAEQAMRLQGSVIANQPSASVTNEGAAGETASNSKIQRYLSRLDDHLWWLHDDAERFDFITSEMAKWEERRDAFIRKVDSGTDPGDVSIFDFTDTLQALEVEQAKYSPLKKIRSDLEKSHAEMRGHIENLEAELNA